MYQRILGKVDQFYLMFGLTLAALFVMVFFTFREVLMAFRTAKEIDQQIIGTAVRLESKQLDQAFNEAVLKQGPSLDLKQ